MGTRAPALPGRVAAHGERPARVRFTSIPIQVLRANRDSGDGGRSSSSVPALRLIDQHGAVFDLRSLADRPVLVSFPYAFDGGFEGLRAMLTGAKASPD
jgi:hypothetical protein